MYLHGDTRRDGDDRTRRKLQHDIFCYRRRRTLPACEVAAFEIQANNKLHQTADLIPFSKPWFDPDFIAGFQPVATNNYAALMQHYRVDKTVGLDVVAEFVKLLD